MASSSEIPRTYDPKPIESKWYAHWLTHKFFRSVPDAREPYTIVIPPPNVTGVLHMGHMLNNTLQDVLVRRARMLGKNACWVPGTDHASIATEAKVVAMLKEKGIHKADLTREEFLKYAWEWKEKYGGIILKQLEKLGASCDWDRTRFTMDEPLSEAVTDVFIDLYNKGYIYRGVRMVNWDPQGLTAVSDEEVIYREVQSKLFYVRYKIEGSADEWLTVATTRPETILGDTAVCVHPEDERYQHLKGKNVIIPIVNRRVPVIFDSYVDKEFGTGALKVTPAHDINDYHLGLKHKLEVIEVIAPDGKMNDAAKFYKGEDRFTARKKIVKDLGALDQLVKVEDIKNKVGYSERTDAVIEPKLSMQWFLRMDQLSKPALENVLNGTIKLIPDKFINTYRHWMENVHDWCISRQLWWGQRIPAWYDGQGNCVVAKTKEAAVKLLEHQYPDAVRGEIRQDEDVLDTWFSSWLWPISVFDPSVFRNPGSPGNKDLQYYYPTNDLVTAPEILFFWVARMIISGYEYMHREPFKNVYLTGIVRDKQGRKMSKSLGNSPDPIELIEKYGADGVRVGMLLCSPAGNDLLFDESYCEQGRNFANKIWNAFRLIHGWQTDEKVSQPESNAVAVEWFSARLGIEIEHINQLYGKHRISEALMATYKLVWDDFCAWYLEMVKPAFVDGKSLPLDAATHRATIDFFEKLLKLLHPFMPFISEELWHLLQARTDKDCIITASWPEMDSRRNKRVIDLGNYVQELVVAFRGLRNQKNIHGPETTVLFAPHGAIPDPSVNAFVRKLCNASIVYSNDSQKNPEDDNLYPFMVQGKQFYMLSSKPLDVDSEKARLLKDIEYQKGFLKSVMAKLSNEKFVANARPDLVANEKKKQSDAERKINALEEELNRLL